MEDISEFLNNLIKPLKAPSGNITGLSMREMFDQRLQELDISQKQAEKILEIDRKSLVPILNKTAKRVDIINILKLANFLNVSAGEFLELYVKEMSTDNVGKLEQTRKTNYIVSTFDIDHLRKAKFLSSKKIDHVEERIIRFFGFDNIFQYDEEKIFPAFSRTKNASNNLMRDFWVKSAYRHFQGINNPYEYDRAALVELIPKFRPQTMNVEQGLFTVAKALYVVGVTLIYQPYLPTVQVRGATFLVNDKPCIVITDFNKNYPTIWFALLHELHHVLYDLDRIVSYHVSSEQEADLFLIEEDANAFARDYLFSDDRRRYIAPFINEEVVVREYAKKSQVHPSFIYNFYNYDKYTEGHSNAWARFKEYFPDVSIATSSLNTHVWEKETVQESVQIIKDTIFNFQIA